MTPFARRVGQLLQVALVAMVTAWVFEIPRGWLGLGVYTEQLLIAALGVGMALLHIDDPLRPPRARDWIAGLGSLGVCLYAAARYGMLTDQAAMLEQEVVSVAGLLLGLLLLATCRVAGAGLLLIVLAMIGYAFIGPHLPGVFQTRSISVARLITYLALDVNGVFGAVLQIVVLLVIPFTMFGQVLAATGGAAFFSGIADALLGGHRGGAAKVAVVGSGLFGMISGSAVSNVLAVGVATIPMMVRAGFAPHKAAAIEAVGSTGGQLCPPVMGAAAFVMAEFMQVPYAAVCAAAIIPSLLYYAALFIHVDLDAARHSIDGGPGARAPMVTNLRRGWIFVLPMTALAFALLFPETLHLTPEKAALAVTALLIVLALIRRDRDPNGQLRSLSDTAAVIGCALVGTARVSLEILIVGAVSGVLVGVLNLSGAAFGMTLQLLALSGGNLFALLTLAAVLAFVLGLGMPTVSVYILTATLLAPALEQAGVSPMAAHMFLMYNGMLSMITPPIAFASSAAAGIARSDPWKTGWTSCVVGWSVFVLPFLFVSHPGLLLQGAWSAVLVDSAQALLAIYLASTAFVGYAFGPLRTGRRIAHVLLALAVVAPLPFAGPFAPWLHSAAAAIAIAWSLYDRSRRPTDGIRP